MFRSVILLVLLAVVSSAHADWFYRLVGFECNQQSDQLVVRYRGAYNEEGKAMVEGKTKTEWNPGELIASMKDDDHIGELTTINAVCRLKHSTYQLSFGPTPGNFNIQGSCGAVVTAWVEIRRGKKVVLPRHEMEGDCHDSEAPVTTEILLSGKPLSSPRFKRLSQEQFVR